MIRRIFEGTGTYCQALRFPWKMSSRIAPKYREDPIESHRSCKNPLETFRYSLKILRKSFQVNPFCPQHLQIFRCFVNQSKVLPRFSKNPQKSLRNNFRIPSILRESFRTLLTSPKLSRFSKDLRKSVRTIPKSWKNLQIYHINPLWMPNNPIEFQRISENLPKSSKIWKILK